jgi:hypothetical protein
MSMLLTLLFTALTFFGLCEFRRLHSNRRVQLMLA